MEFFVTLFPVFITGITAYFYQWAIRRLQCPGAAIKDDFYIFERTAAFDAFLSFITGSVLTISAVFGLLGSISNHSVISLDILYISSLLILVLYHFLKVSYNPSVNTQTA
jgi:hypothetical protein